MLFVFATTEPRKVPATIVSRCQRFDFRRIPASQMAGYLAREAAGEGIEIDPEALAMVTRASGEARDALSMMDQLVSFSGGRITREKRFLAPPGSAGGHPLRPCFRDARRKAGRCLDILSGAFAMGYSVEELDRLLVEFMRNLMLAASGGEAGLADLAEVELESFRRLAASTCDTAVLDTLRIITAAASESKQSSQPRIVLESAVMAASRLRWAVGLDSLPRVSSVPGPADQAAAPSPAHPAERAAAAPGREEVVTGAEPSGRSCGGAGVGNADGAPLRLRTGRNRCGGRGGVAGGGRGRPQPARSLRRGKP